MKMWDRDIRIRAGIRICMDMGGQCFLVGVMSIIKC